MLKSPFCIVQGMSKTTPSNEHIVQMEAPSYWSPIIGTSNSPSDPSSYGSCSITYSNPTFIISNFPVPIAITQHLLKIPLPVNLPQLLFNVSTQYPLGLSYSSYHKLTHLFLHCHHICNRYSQQVCSLGRTAKGQSALPYILP